MLIGISGKIGSGKDTIGKIIQFLTLPPNEFSLTNKDILADMQHKWYCADKSSFRIKKFADTLKDIVCLLIGCTREQLEDREFKEKELGEEWWYYKPSDTMYPYLEYKQYADQHYGININSEDLVKLTPRLLLQLIGTECGRNIIHPNIWCISTFSNYIINKVDEDFLNMTLEDAKSFGLIE